jgi:hypothetical protein
MKLDYPFNLGQEEDLNPGSRDQITEWSLAGHTIILTTGRKECWREETEVELKKHKILYDSLIMGLPTGQRVLINDNKPEDTAYPMAVAHSLDRNKGMAGLTGECDVEVPPTADTCKRWPKSMPTERTDTNKKVIGLYDLPKPPCPTSPLVGGTHDVPPGSTTCKNCGNLVY